MLVLLLLPLLFVFQPSRQNPSDSNERAPVVVMSSRWFKDRQPAENAVASPRPQPEMIAANKNFERQRRINASAGERDPNQDSLDGRSAALDKAIEQSRESEDIEGFTYEVKFKNLDTKPAQTIFWEYQFKEIANPANISRRRFACVVKIKPDKERQLRVFSTLGPSNVINVKNLSKGSGNQFDELVVIDRIEYEDGSAWQRKDWNFDEVKLTAKARGDRLVCRSF